MKQLAARLACSWCGLKLDRLAGEHRCRVCNAPLCDPIERTCAWDHHDSKHRTRRAKGG